VKVVKVSKQLPVSPPVLITVEFTEAEALLVLGRVACITSATGHRYSPHASSTVCWDIYDALYQALVSAGVEIPSFPYDLGRPQPGVVRR
jgi:hypothetical protein